MARIELDRVVKAFKDAVVLPELTLAVEDGEFFTFVGPSGCGKSTLLNLLAGLEPASAGRILFDGAVVNDLSPRDRDVAMVFQSYALYPHMSVYENLAFPLRMRKMERARIDREVRRVAELLAIADKLRVRPAELSGGQRQRVALGRAIVRRPKVFLMDEPLSNLDARLRVDMRRELKTLHQELRITTVYVTHEQAEAMSLSDRIAVLRAGRIQQCGTPAEVFLEPSNLFVAGFIGSPPMNLLPGSVRSLEPFTVECNGLSFVPKAAGRPGGRDLTVGIRPEEWEVRRQAGEGDVPVRVEVVEPAGSFSWIDFRWGGLVARGKAALEQDLRPGEDAWASFPAEKTLVFDSASQTRV
ncbi:MAG: ABC transporter ATP-binding protein [Deltaproteobacteria bacterium]|nr:ABC transporter ATP-binding protein [Deltaproteobacteria bacterium]